MIECSINSIWSSVGFGKYLLAELIIRLADFKLYSVSSDALDSIVAISNLLAWSLSRRTFPMFPFDPIRTITFLDIKLPIFL